MKIAYLTHDDVNAAHAHALARSRALELVVLDVRQTDPEADRVVCDLDHLPRGVADALLANARRGIDLSAVGVHSYHLTAREAAILRAAGATVSRRLARVLRPAPVSLAACG